MANENKKPPIPEKPIWLIKNRSYSVDHYGKNSTNNVNLKGSSLVSQRVKQFGAVSVQNENNRLPVELGTHFKRKNTENQKTNRQVRSMFYFDNVY